MLTEIHFIVMFLQTFPTVLGEDWLNIAYKFATLGVWGWVGAVVRTYGRKLIHKQRYHDFQIEAMKYALQKHFQNGFEANYKEKLEELVEKENFIIQ